MSKATILAKFKKAATAKPTATAAASKDPVEAFISRARDQQKLVANVKKGSAHEPRKQWFRPHKGGFTFRLGKDGIPVGGEKYFQVASLDEVNDFLNDAIELAQSDEEFKTAIRDASTDRSTRLKKGRAAKA
jgi:hypothetical protein